MVLELRSSNPVSNGVGLGPTLKVPAVIHDDFTPTTSPTNSPTLPRHRILSISNPAPVLKLVARGMVQKVCGGEREREREGCEMRGGEGGREGGVYVGIQYLSSFILSRCLLWWSSWKGR